MKVLIVIPAHNEADSLPAVVANLRQHRGDAEILIVDDGSTDETQAVVERLRVSWLRLGSWIGVGSAMRAGFRYAAERGFEMVVRLDGDGQHDARSIDALLAPIARGAADVVRGSRYLGQATYQAEGVRRMAQQIAARLLSAITGEGVTDPTSGFWAFGPRAIQLLASHHPRGYPEPELLLLLHKNGLKTIEMPVHMRERFAGRTTLRGARTALATAHVLLALIVVPLRPVVERPRP
jgi:glycosyltransferase involved in cell wall biosynthesis